MNPWRSLDPEALQAAMSARIKGVKVHQYPDYPSPEPDLGPARPIKQAEDRKRTVNTCMNSACGKKFFITPKRAADGFGKYCSMACRRK
jgi:hypothetical protein